LALIFLKEQQRTKEKIILNHVHFTIKNLIFLSIRA
jgi:hypothetical protein